MSACFGQVNRLDVRRPQTTPWLILRMCRRLSIVLLIFIGGPVLGADIPALVRKAKPAVVQLLCYDQDKELVKTGTGFFISPDGVLLTNCHLLEGGVYSVVAKTISGRRYSNMRILSAPDEDHAMEEDVTELQFDDARDVPYLSLGSSHDTVEGERVLVIGNPDGLTGTVSDGIISAFRKEGAMIQITAPISPGSSGSPVLDESGNVIGIATAIDEEGQNLNFAISADAVKVAIVKGSPDKEPSEEELAQESLRRAREKFKNRDYQGALTFFNLFLFVHSDDATVYTEHARVCFKLGYPDQAISDYTKAIQLKPDYVVAYFGRGGLYYKLGRYAEAIKDITEAIRLRPNNAELYEARAKVYDSIGDHAQAEADRKKAMELGPR
jgi:hypothetical protein